MIEAFEIGISLALHDGISDSILEAQRNVAELERAVNAIGIPIQSLREAGARAVAIDSAEPLSQPGSSRNSQNSGRLASANYANEAERAAPGERNIPDSAPAQSVQNAHTNSDAAKSLGLLGLQSDTAAKAHLGERTELTDYLSPTIPLPYGVEEFTDRSDLVAGSAVSTDSDYSRQSRPTAPSTTSSSYEPEIEAATSGFPISVAPSIGRRDNSIGIESFALPRSDALQPATAEHGFSQFDQTSVVSEERSDGGSIRPQDVPPHAPVTPLFSRQRVEAPDRDYQGDEEGKKALPTDWPRGTTTARTVPNASLPDFGGQERSVAPQRLQREAGRIAGDVYLDGMLVGRWISRFLQREWERADAGPTGFDPKRGRFLPGVTVGG